MYALAATLDPDVYERLATAVFGEMLLAGYTVVGEFHYLHHQPGGVPYADANEIGRRLLRAADTAGLRITLLDTCYLHGGFGVAPNTVQRRFSDGTAAAWVERVDGARRRRIAPCQARRRRPFRPRRRSAGDRRRRGVGGRARRRAPCPRVGAAAGERRLLGRPRLHARRAAGAPFRPRTSGSARSTRRTSRRATSGCSPPPAPCAASARPPSATWPTGSDQRRPWARGDCASDRTRMR